MRCPNCNAMNPDGAGFCSLCLTSFSAKEEALPPSVAGPPAHEVESKEPLVSPPAGAGWTCSVCGAVNPVAEDVCRDCGTSLFDSLRRSEGDARQETLENKSSNVAAALSLVPGAGHFYLGMVGQGVARFILFTWWFGLAAVLPDSRGPVALVRVLLFLGAMALILVSALDSYRAVEEPGSGPILDRRLMLYSSLAVVGLLVAGVFSAVISARS